MKRGGRNWPIPPGFHLIEDLKGALKGKNNFSQTQVTFKPSHPVLGQNPDMAS